MIFPASGFSWVMKSKTSKAVDLGELPGHASRRLQQYAALQEVANQPGIAQRSLAGAVGLDTSTIAGVTDRLEARGLLARSGAGPGAAGQARPGFTASSATLEGGVRVDVPLRVFYAGDYPTLVRLYAALGVASEPVSYATSFSGADGRLFFRYRNGRWGDRSLGYLAPADLLLGPSSLRILGGLLSFNGLAVPALRRGELKGLSIGDHVAAQRCEPAFVEGFLLPAIATVCTCSYTHARPFPAEVIVDDLARRLLADASVSEARLLEPVLQTVHPLRQPNAASAISRSAFERPVVGPDSAPALQRLRVLHAESERRLWFCGSHAQDGIPLLESAVRSAHDLAERLGAALD